VTPLRVDVALMAPLGAPVDAEPRAAALRAAEALARLGHEVAERTPDWDDERFPAAWSTFALGTLQHVLRVVGRLHGGAADPERLEPATRSWIADRPPVSAADHLEAAEELWRFARRVLADWPGDRVLVTPTLTRLPVPAGTIRAEAGVTSEAMRFSVLVRMWNVTGQPAITLPLHATPDGVPVGVQLVGPPGRDDLVLALAAQLEDAAGLQPAARIAQPLVTGAYPEG
jgi:amidase